MKKQYLILFFAAALTNFHSMPVKRRMFTKHLIITGQSDHNWEASSPVLKQILDEHRFVLYRNYDNT